MDIMKLFAGGFPATIETLAFMQDTYSKPLKALSNLTGNKAILIGIVDNAGTVSEGWFTYDGEPMFFKLSNSGATVSIVEKTIQVPYEEDADADGNLDLKDAYVSRYATTNDPIDVDEVLIATFPFTDLSPITNFRALFPVGMGVLWFDPANIPAGFVVADGDGGIGGVLSNGQPVRDLRNMFIKGAGSEQLVNTVSGARTKTIAANNLPPHVHAQTPHTHTQTRLTTVGSGGIGYEAVGDDGHLNYQTVNTGLAGGGNTGNGLFANDPLNIEPLHYAAIWLQYNGV